MNDIDLKGRIAIVSGGAGGIGGAIVERLLSSGASVAIWDIRPTDERRENAASFAVDVTSKTSIQGAMQATLDRFDGLDILVTAAGATGPTAPVADYAETEWGKAIAINLSSVFLTCQAVLPMMTAGGYGRIVNIASIAGKEGNVNLAPYSAAKAGVIAFTKVLARELAETGIRCNAVTPGLFRTDILKQMSDEAIQWSLDRIPMKRAGQLDEIGAMVAWLVSEECSFSTGAVFDISGGRATY